MIFGFLPSGMNSKANEMVKYRGNNPSSWQRITINEAQDYANKGYFVVGGWINPSGSSGHVVLIVPGTAEYSGSWNANLPKAMDTGEGKRWDNNGLENSFGIKKKINCNFIFINRSI